MKIPLLLLFPALFLLAFGSSLLIWPMAGPRLEGLLGRWRSRTRKEEPGLLKDDALSDIPALDRALRPVKLLSRLQGQLEQADLPVRPGMVILISLVLALGAGYAASVSRYSNGLFIVVLMTVVAWLPYVYVRYRRAARLAKIQAALPAALDLMASALQAGHPVSAAFAMVARETKGPLATEFAATLAEEQWGLSFERALAHLADRVPLEDMRFFTVAVQIQKEAGGNLVELFETLSQTMRERFELHGHIRSVSAQGRLTGLVLAALPLVVGMLMYFFNRSYLSVLFEDPVGRAMLWSMAVCQVLGFLFIRKIVRIRV